MKRLFLVVYILSGCLYASSGGDSFGDLNGTFIYWLNGNLGKLLALIGIVIWFLGFLMDLCKEAE